MPTDVLATGGGSQAGTPRGGGGGGGEDGAPAPTLTVCVLDALLLQSELLCGVLWGLAALQGFCRCGCSRLLETTFSRNLTITNRSFTALLSVQSLPRKRLRTLTVYLPLNPPTPFCHSPSMQATHPLPPIHPPYI